MTPFALDFVAAALLGGLVGAGELSSRYRGCLPVPKKTDGAAATGDDKNSGRRMWTSIIIGR